MANKAELRKGLRAAFRAAGTQRELARRLRISEQAIGRWTWVPAGRVLDVERVTGVPREVLRPDLYRGMVRAAAA